MDLETIKIKVKEHIEQSIAGLSKEDVKFDFKAKWHDLSTGPGRNEFLKDTSSIANTFGLDGFLVYGFDDKANQFTGAKFSDSKLRDSNELYGVLIKGLGVAFDLNHYDIEIDGNYLSVLHIPPALNKPFLILNYQKWDKKGKIREEKQKNFIRKNTGTFEATKNDIEIMYYDRKNIIPEYDAQISLLKLGSRSDGYFKITIENTGRRPICINSLYLIVAIETQRWVLSCSTAKLIPYATPLSHYYVGSGDIKTFEGMGKFLTSGRSTPKNMIVQIQKGVNLMVVLNLTNGKVINVKAEVPVPNDLK